MPFILISLWSFWCSFTTEINTYVFPAFFIYRRLSSHVYSHVRILQTSGRADYTEEERGIKYDGCSILIEFNENHSQSLRTRSRISNIEKILPIHPGSMRFQYVICEQPTDGSNRDKYIAEIYLTHIRCAFSLK